MLQLFLTNIIINKTVQRKELNFVFWEQEISIPCNNVVARCRLEGSSNSNSTDINLLDMAF